MFQFDADKVLSRPKSMVYSLCICGMIFDLRVASNFQYHSVYSSNDDDHRINDQITLSNDHHYSRRKNWNASSSNHNEIDSSPQTLASHHHILDSIERETASNTHPCYSHGNISDDFLNICIGSHHL